jgi:WD40 repeat protein
MHSGEVWAAAFGADGQTVLTGSSDNTARLWDARTGKPLSSPLLHAKTVWAVAFSAAQDPILTASLDGTARMWPIPSAIRGTTAGVVLWTQVLSGVELDDVGGIHVLDAALWDGRKRALDQRSTSSMQ